MATCDIRFISILLNNITETQSSFVSTPMLFPLKPPACIPEIEYSFHNVNVVAEQHFRGFEEKASKEVEQGKSGVIDSALNSFLFTKGIRTCISVAIAAWNKEGHFVNCGLVHIDSPYGDHAVKRMIARMRERAEEEDKTISYMFAFVIGAYATTIKDADTIVKGLKDSIEGLAKRNITLIIPQVMLNPFQVPENYDERLVDVADFNLNVGIFNGHVIVSTTSHLPAYDKRVKDLQAFAMAEMANIGKLAKASAQERKKLLSLIREILEKNEWSSEKIQHNFYESTRKFLQLLA